MNRNGTAESAQISKMGVITFTDGKFAKNDVPFNIKNDGSDAILLEVNLWDMPEGEYVSTYFDCGWNPEIVRSVKQPTGTVDLKWGM